MKHLFTPLLILITVTAFSQVADTTKTATPPKVEADTITVDLLKHGAFDKLRAIDQQRMEIKAQAEVLQERSKGLDIQVGNILDGEYRHDVRYELKREVLSYSVVATNLVIVVKKVPAPPVEDKKKKQK
jgi:hypothetical protein